MNKFIYNMYTLLLSILLWIFIWNIFDIFFDEMKISNKKKLIFYSVCLTITIIVIYTDKDFFKNA